MFLPLLAGSLHVGDEIIEINGQSVSNQSVDQLQKMLVGICVWQGCSPGRTPLACRCACWVSIHPLLDTRANTQLCDTVGARATVLACSNTSKHRVCVRSLGAQCLLLVSGLPRAPVKAVSWVPDMC